MKNLRGWYLIHKWSSLVCTVFLLILCLTGLPLIFSHEIDEYWNAQRSYEKVAPETVPPRLDTLLDQARLMYPGQLVTSVSADAEEPQVVISMTPSYEAAKIDPTLNHWLRFDSRTGKLLEQSNPMDRESDSQPLVVRLLGICSRLHIDLYAQLPGQILLAAMGLLFIAANVSGVVLYGRFMKKLDFGTVRTARSTRLKWLDLHNLLGTVLLAWLLVVGVSGVFNELSGPLFRFWMGTDVELALAPWHGVALPSQTDMASVQRAYDMVRAALPNAVVENLIFPNNELGSPYHYLLWTKGDSPITSRLFNGALVDARTGQLSALLDMPWYLRALQVSRPLHFGDYGGLPLKLLWMIFDLVTIAVLCSGMYLWISRRKSNALRIERMARGQELDLPA